MVSVGWEMKNSTEIFKHIEKSIYKTTELFYQNKIEEGHKLLDLTIQTILDGIDEIYRLYQGLNLRVDDGTLNNILMKAMTALEAKDFVLLSDILRYELLETIREYIFNFIERQGEHDDNI